VQEEAHELQGVTLLADLELLIGAVTDGLYSKKRMIKENT
jgi:hypothetical protein